MSGPDGDDGSATSARTSSAPVGSLLLQVVRAHAQLGTRLLRREGVVPPQEIVLLHLDEQGPVAQADLVHYLGRDRSTVTNTLQAMERAGLIERTPSPTDRRAMVVGLTEEGRRRIPGARAAWHRLEEVTTRGLTDAQRSALLRALAVVRDELDRALAEDGEDGERPRQRPPLVCRACRSPSSSRPPCPSPAPPAVDAVGVGVFAVASTTIALPTASTGPSSGPAVRGSPGRPRCPARTAGRRALGLGPAERSRSHLPPGGRRVRPGRLTDLAIDVLGSLPDRLDAAEIARALAEGVMLGSYRYTALKSDPSSHIESLTVVGEGRHTLSAITGGGRSASVHPGPTSSTSRAARSPHRLRRPSGLGSRASTSGARPGAIEREKLGGLLGVNRLDRGPRFLLLSWDPGGEPRGTVALVGKGITFDSGGLSLKPSDSMVGMKGDMAGAAAVLATFTALDAVQPPVRVRGYLPLTDNMPGGNATRVGDVLRIRNGTTVEVLNTDAEGRLVLADTLALASEGEPDAIVDLATLTGVHGGARPQDRRPDGQPRRLRRGGPGRGRRRGRAGLAAATADEMRKALDSEVADPKNIGNDRYGALLAGVFLRSSSATASPGPTSTSPARPSPPRTTPRPARAHRFGVRTRCACCRPSPPPDRAGVRSTGHRAGQDPTSRRSTAARPAAASAGEAVSAERQPGDVGRQAGHVLEGEVKRLSAEVEQLAEEGDEDAPPDERQARPVARAAPTSSAPRPASTQSAGRWASAPPVRRHTCPASPDATASVRPIASPPAPTTIALPPAATARCEPSQARRPSAVASSGSARPADSSPRGRSADATVNPAVMTATMSSAVAKNESTRSPPAWVTISAIPSLSPIRSSTSPPSEP